MSNKLTGFTLALLATSLSAMAQNNNPSGQQAATTSIVRYGDSLAIGNGRYQTYVRTNSGKPEAIGVEFSKATLSNLPIEPDNDGTTCFDTNGDNNIDLETECVGGHSRTMSFESNPTPFKTITINWESHGHVPAGVYDKAHFDFHFYMMEDSARKQIFTGTCPGLVNCDQATRAVVPLAAKYVHPDFFNTNLVYAAMGNHYADGTSPEFHGLGFSNTFILGSYEGHLTFFEPMITLDYLLGEPNECKPVKQPAAFEKAGWYPTQYCVRYSGYRKVYSISLEGFKYRIAG